MISYESKMLRKDAHLCGQSNQKLLEINRRAIPLGLGESAELILYFNRKLFTSSLLHVQILLRMVQSLLFHPQTPCGMHEASEK